jgi:hypothetical protein
MLPACAFCGYIFVGYGCEVEVVEEVFRYWLRKGVTVVASAELLS